MNMTYLVIVLLSTTLHESLIASKSMQKSKTIPAAAPLKKTQSNQAYANKNSYVPQFDLQAESQPTAKQLEKDNTAIDKALLQKAGIKSLTLEQLKEQYLQEALSTNDDGTRQSITRRITNINQRLKNPIAKDNELEITNKVSIKPIPNEPVQNNAQDAQMLKSLKTLLKPQAITSPEVIDIVNNAKTMDEINQQFTNLIMTTENPRTSADILLLSTNLNRKFPFDKSTDELYQLAEQRNNNVRFTMNNPSQSLEQKIAGLNNRLSQITKDFSKASNENLSQDYKDNVTKLYTDAITELTKQKTAQDQAKIAKDQAKIAQDQAQVNTTKKELDSIVDQAPKNIETIMNNDALTSQEKKSRLLNFGNDQANNESNRLQDLNELNLHPDALAQAQESISLKTETIQSLINDKIAELETKSPTEILNHDIQALKNQNKNTNQSISTYISNTLSILSKRGSLTVRTITSTISSIFKKAGVDVPQEQQDAMAKIAAEHAPGDNASPATKASWISSVSNMVYDAITKYLNRNNNANLATADEAIRV